MATPLLRLRLRIAYDGRPFRGWQSQATKDAVQDHLEAAFAGIVGRRVIVVGSGRTDAGVHALGQIAHADVPRDGLTPKKWQSALNASLPPEIRVLSATTAAPTFHAQYDATGKTYTYRIWNDSFLHPLEIGRAWFYPSPLDLSVFRTGAALLVGQHDFARFAVNRGEPDADCVRTIHKATVHQSGTVVIFRVTGDGFLYKMVRLLTGSLARCAQGRASLDWIRDLLENPSATKTHFAAPAEGLYLTRVAYGPSRKNSARSRKPDQHEG